MPEAARQFGTHMHGLDMFGKGALCGLLADLDSASSNGFQPGQCDHVKAALSRIARELDTLPQDTFLRQMWAGFSEFREGYAVWNEMETNTSQEAVKHRKDSRKKLKLTKTKLYRLFNSEQLRLEEEFGYDLVDRLYGAMEELVVNEPNDFPELGTAVARWRRFRPGSVNPHPRLLRAQTIH